MADEPSYLKMLRKNREAQSQKGSAGSSKSNKGKFTVQESEAMKWAKEVAAGADLKSIRELAGARYAVLLKLSSVTGTASHSLEGIPTREALLERLKKGPGMGEEVLGAYEVKGGRPITTEMEGGEVRVTLGAPRSGANPLPPEKMLRKAIVEAAKREKTRPKGGEGRGGR